MEFFGYAGGVLHVDLTPDCTGNKIAGCTKLVLPDAEDHRQYVASGIAGTAWFGTMRKRAGYDRPVFTGTFQRREEDV